MFIGHYGLALATKRAAPRVSLGALIAAAQPGDLIWSMLLLVGLEHVSIVPNANAALRGDRKGGGWWLDRHRAPV
jgi:hypothetical protein